VTNREIEAVLEAAMAEDKKRRFEGLLLEWEGRKPKRESLSTTAPCIIIESVVILPSIIAPLPSWMRGWMWLSLVPTELWKGHF
jgi:hypothetical protein